MNHANVSRSFAETQNFIILSFPDPANVQQPPDSDDCLAAKLRAGNVHSADGWKETLLPEIGRHRKLGREMVLRADAAFAKPATYEALWSTR